MLFHHCTKFGAKMLLDAELWAKIEIQDGGRPSSWIFENLISEHWEWDPLGCCDNYRVSGALEKLEHETNLQDRAADR